MGKQIVYSISHQNKRAYGVVVANQWGAKQQRGEKP